MVFGFPTVHAEEWHDKHQEASVDHDVGKKDECDLDPNISPFVAMCAPRFAVDTRQCQLHAREELRQPSFTGCL